MRTRTKKPQQPTIDETQVLAMIARSFLRKTLLPTRKVPLWQIEGGIEISNECAQKLIRNGWLRPQRDGLSMFDESQTYVALSAPGK